MKRGCWTHSLLNPTVQHVEVCSTPSQMGLAKAGSVQSRIRKSVRADEAREGRRAG